MVSGNSPKKTKFSSFRTRTNETSKQVKGVVGNILVFVCIVYESLKTNDKKRECYQTS